MLLSVVMPVYNERETLFEIIRRVLAVPLTIDRELVLVDDYSRDGTRDLYAKLPQEFPGANIRVILHEVNKGKGAALRTGFEQVNGDIVIVQDADLEYNPTDYPKLLAPILAGKADVVYGSRFAQTGDERRVLHFWHTLGNSALTLFSNMMTDLKITDMETCYKVFRAEVLRKIKIKSDRFGVEPEITAKIARLGCRVYEVSIQYDGRTYDAGKKITWKDGVKALITIVRFSLWD